MKSFLRSTCFSPFIRTLEKCLIVLVSWLVEFNFTFFSFSVADLLLSKSQSATLINNNDLSTEDSVQHLNFKTLTTTTTDLPGWTWWSPVSFDKSENKNGDDRESVENDDGTEERLWEREDITINDAPDSNVSSETDQRRESQRDNREGGAAQFDDPVKKVDNGWDNFLKEANTEVHKEDDVGDDKEELRDKYLELMTHNTKMVDILKKTLEMQAEMFRKLIKYIFP